MDLDRKFSLYCIKVTTNMDAYVKSDETNNELSEFLIYRRYSEFVDLYKLLRHISSVDLPKFPSKVLFGRFDLKVIEERKNSLEGLLKFVSKHRGLKSSAPMISFCLNGRLPMKQVIIMIFF